MEHKARTPFLKDGLLFQQLDFIDFCICVCMGVVVFWTRHHFAGSVYFVDGPSLVRAIQSKTFVIQSPGYWVFARMGGLFHDPAAGLAFWTQLFSALGVAVFLLLCRSFGLTRGHAVIAALAYSSIYFVWFSGEIHSTYAAEILFPPLTVLCFRYFQQGMSPAWACAMAASAAAAVALRPSDGVFLVPLWLFLLIREKPPKGLAVMAALVFTALCLTWYIPSRMAMLHAGYVGSTLQILSFAHITSVLFVGLTWRSLANLTRVVVPLLVAFWMFLPALFSKRPRDVNALLFWWSAPGLLFFLLLYIADPTYMVFATGSAILMAALCCNRRTSLLILGICLIWNSALFLGAQPLARDDIKARLWDFYVAKYCVSGIRSQFRMTLGRVYHQQ